MTTRILPPEEWHKLDGTEAAPVWRSLNPETSRVLVVEDAAGDVIGTWLAYPMVHVECIWVAPAHRGRSRVLARLLQGMRELVQSVFGVQAALGSVSNDGMRTMLQTIGGHPLGEFYLVPMQARGGR